MDIKEVRTMANKIAAEQTDDALVKVEAAIDNIIESIYQLDENIDSVESLSPDQTKAIAKVKDLVDTAIAPYTADIIEAMKAFEE